MFSNQLDQWLQWLWDPDEEMNALEMRHMRRIRRVIPDRMNPFIAASDDEFVDRFRLKKESVNSIIQEIQDDLPVANNRRGW